jgi:hypothetical protein
MKLINNQDVVLIKELKALIRPESEVYIATGYTSIPAIFHLFMSI